MKRLSEDRLALLATLLVELHLLNVGSWRPALIVAAVAGLRPLLPATLRAALDVVFAAGALTAAMLHLLHIRWDGFARTDATGVALLGAVVLFTGAAATALRARKRTTRARRIGRALATLAGAVPLALFAVLPLVVAMWLGGKPRRPLEPSTFPVAHSNVTLRAADGTRLSGWWVPSKNGGTVVLVHGGGGDRNGVRRQALLLARHGYGVLLYDERGRGRSGGTTQSMGWNWVQDVEAGVDFALRQPSTRRVGALGLSTGAEVAVTAAAHDPRIRGVVAEGLINRDLADSRHQRASDNVTGLPYWWATFAALEVETGTQPPEPLTDDLRRIAPRPLLIVAAEKNLPERVVAPVWRRSAGPTARLWLADNDHTHALETFPREYERRVVGLFDRALLTGGHRPKPVLHRHGAEEALVDDRDQVQWFRRCGCVRAGGR
jgi:uncharacterized protein